MSTTAFWQKNEIIVSKPHHKKQWKNRWLFKDIGTMNVYIVIEDCYNDETQIIGIFSTKEKAVECVDRIKKKRPNRFYIEDWKIDEEIYE